LANLLSKGRNSAIVILCFDAWRTLMYCRVTHDLGREAVLIEQLEHERDKAVYQHQLEMMKAKNENEREIFLQVRVCVCVCVCVWVGVCA
jgi:hypothetical protein